MKAVGNDARLMEMITAPSFCPTCGKEKLAVKISTAIDGRIACIFCAGAMPPRDAKHTEIIEEHQELKGAEAATYDSYDEQRQVMAEAAWANKAERRSVCTPKTEREGWKDGFGRYGNSRRRRKCISRVLSRESNRATGRDGEFRYRDLSSAGWEGDIGDSPVLTEAVITTRALSLSATIQAHQGQFLALLYPAASAS